VVLHPNSTNADVSLSHATGGINFVEGLNTGISGIGINVKKLPPGIYFIEARGERVLRGKFVKE
jgi:UDP-N-acetylmuramyl pentapeptide synthase